MDVRQFDLNLLVALDALLIERNVTRAGQQIGISQSAMSGILAKLRQLLHDDLLVRVGRQMELTALAEELAGPVRECVQNVESVLNTRRNFDPTMEQRTFTIAATDYVIYLIFSSLVKRLADLAPNVVINFTGINPGVFEELKSGKIDFAITPLSIDADASSKPLFKDRWTCVVWSGHPTVNRKLTEKEFLELPQLAFRRSGNELESFADRHLRKLGLRQHAVAFAGAFVLIPFLLRGTSLIALLQKRLAERVCQAADLKMIEPPFKLPSIQEKIFWNPRYSADSAHLWMRSQIEEVVKLL